MAWVQATCKTFKVFRSKPYAHVPKQRKFKLDSKAEESIIVSYAPKRKKIQNPKS